MSEITADHPHGTASAYQHYRCRCAACREAWATYMRSWYHRTGRSRPRAEYLAERRAAPPVHGTEGCYVHRGCRCGPCREASASARRARRKAAA